MRKSLFYFEILLILAPFTSFGQLPGVLNSDVANVIFTGEKAGDLAGYHISIIGDVNNDRIDDILIGAPFNSEAGIEHGQVYLIFGKSTAWDSVFNLQNADASFHGSNAKDWASHDVFGIGDVNNDGIDDFAIGVKFVDQAAFNAGKVYVFYGKPSGWNLDTPINNADASFLGEGSTSEAAHVMPVGDVNGDGIADMMIGSGFNDQVGTNAGKAYLVFGSSTGWAKEVSLASANASFLAEAPGDNAGHRVAGIGDVNGDNLNDFLIGADAKEIDKVKFRGKVYLILGKITGWNSNTNLANADASFIGPGVSHTHFGWNLCGVGDANGDGLDDMLIAGQGRSKIYLIFGKTTGWAANSDIEIVADVTFTSATDQDHAGYDMRSLGDLNDDGYADFIIGAYSDNQVGTAAGKAYLYYGRSNWANLVALTDADATFLAESAGDSAGWSVAGGKGYIMAGKERNGDVNGDGIGDFLIAAPRNDDNGNNAGKIYLFFGSTNAFQVNRPNGGEIWYLNNRYQVTWNSSNPGGIVRIEFSGDSGGSWELITETADTGSYWWDIATPASNHCLIKISQMATGRTDQSDSEFNIINPVLTVLSPNGYEKWTIGDTHTINWNSECDTRQVKIEYSVNNGDDWTSIVDSTSNTGTYEWIVPATPSTSCLVQVQDAHDGIPIDRSDNLFEIMVPASINLLSPIGGEEWYVDSLQEIKWKSVNLSDSIRIELSRDNGQTWEILAEIASGDSSWIWTVTAPHSETCLVRVGELDGKPMDTSTATFAIVVVRSLTIAKPNGGEVWPIDSWQEILWNSQNTSGQVKIELSRDRGTTWELLNGNKYDDGRWYWQVTGYASLNCLMRIYDGTGNPADTSDNQFTIDEKPVIDLLTPNGGEKWEIDSEQEITWSSINTSGCVKLELSRDLGISWEIIQETIADSGHYTWTVTGPASDSCLVRITDRAGKPGDLSGNSFSIEQPGSLTVLDPNGGEIWEVGSQKDILWTALNFTGNITIELTRNNGIVWETLGETGVVAAGFTWTITGPPSDSCRIRIKSKDNDLEDLSDSTFSIQQPTRITSASMTIPDSYGLSQNYPNPFNPVTTIRFDIPTMIFVSLKLYDNRGREIKTVLAGTVAAGCHALVLNCSNLPSGIYYYRMVAGDFVAIKKLILIK